jgi:hypothetical protein
MRLPSEGSWKRKDKECVASFPRILFLSTTLTTTLDHHYPRPLLVFDTITHTMDTIQQSYLSGAAIFSQNTPSSLSQDLDCLSFPSSPSLPSLAQNSYPTPPNQALWSLYHNPPLYSPPIGSFPTHSTLHTSILDSSAWSGAEFKATCASLTDSQANNHAYRMLKETLMATQVALIESRFVIVYYLLLLSN